LFTALQRMDVPSRMLYFPDEGHWILKPQNSKLWHETVADWCDRWTKTNAYATGPAYVPMAPVVPRPAAKASTIPTIPGIPKAKVQSPPKPEVLPRVTAPVVPAAEAAAVAPKAAAPAEVPKVQDRVAAGAERAAFVIAISAPNDEMAVGSDALVSIALKNISGKQILFGHHPGRDNPEFSYRIEVRSAAGKVVEETAYGRGAMERQQSESRSVDYVQPGGTAMQTAHLGKLFSLNKPGRYTVQVERRDAENKVMVRSNEITLNVVP
jgi:hypothetical protein